MRGKKRVLFVSGELIGADLCLKLKREGCDVRLFIKDKSRKDCLDGMVQKIGDWRKELDWVGKDGLIIFDDVGYGKIQDRLRKRGYNVVGGSGGGDRLEQDRQYGQEIFSACGIKIVETISFDNLKDAGSFVKNNRCPWVVKQQGHLSMLSYVGKMDDASDVLHLLENYQENKKIKGVSLQKRLQGIEVGVARYFNGNDWVGPIEINIEHKSLFDNGVGPMTGEMGTVMFYVNDEKNKLFQNTLAKLKDYLREVNFRGDIDVDLIIDKSEFYPIEATARFGCPSTQLHDALHISPWSEFLTAVARGEKYDLKYNKGYGVVVSVAIPPFPYKAINRKYYLKDVGIFFRNGLDDEKLKHIHFEEVSLNGKNGKSKYCVAGSNGYILYVTGVGDTVEQARQRAYSLVDEIIIPRMFYRSDIGLKFMEQDQKLLHEWGWI